MSLRARLMIIGLAGVGIALIMGGLAFFAALTYSVDRTLDNEALASAQEVAAMVNENRLPNPIPVSGAQVVQVVDAQQRVIGGSVTADRLTPLLRPNELATALAGEAVVVDGVRVGNSEPLRVRAIHAGSADAPVSVIIGLPFGDVLATRTALRNALLITFPLLLAALAAIAWRVIGWTLRPVEQLRAGAEQISRTGRIRGSARGERLPVPTAADEIRALAVTLNEMLDRLADAQERQRSFVADAAHELRSPLANIQAQLEVAERLGEGGTLTRRSHGRCQAPFGTGRRPAAPGARRRRHQATSAVESCRCSRSFGRGDWCRTPMLEFRDTRRERADNDHGRCR